MEFELDGSDTSWLVYADYLEDQGIDATHIREGVEQQQINNWTYEGLSMGKVGSNNEPVGSSWVGGRDLVGGGSGHGIDRDATRAGSDEICGGVGGNYYIRELDPLSIFG